MGAQLSNALYYMKNMDAYISMLEEAGQQTMAFLREHIPEARTVPLCGNSIGTDRHRCCLVPLMDCTAM